MILQKLCGCLALPFLVAGLGLAQTTSPETHGEHPSQSLVFDVVSVRPHNNGGPQSYGPTPDGYHMKNMPLMLPIITAYIPTSGSAFFTPQSLLGTTDWMLM